MGRFWFDNFPTQNVHTITVVTLFVFYVVGSFLIQPPEYVVNAVGVFLMAYGGIEAGRFVGKRFSWKPEGGAYQEEDST